MSAFLFKECQNSFSSLSSIPLFVHTVFALSIHVLVDLGSQLSVFSQTKWGFPPCPDLSFLTHKLPAQAPGPIPTSPLFLYSPKWQHLFSWSQIPSSADGFRHIHSNRTFQRAPKLPPTFTPHSSLHAYLNMYSKPDFLIFPHPSILRIKAIREPFSQSARRLEV